MRWKLIPSVLLVFQLNALASNELHRQWSHEFDDFSQEQKPPPPVPPENLQPQGSWQDFFANLENASKVVFGLAWDGAVPYRSHDTEGFTPASTLKMVTAATALEVLGEEFKFSNSFQGTLETTSGMLINPEFNLSGDPTWGHPAFGESLTSRLEMLVASLKQAKVKAIRGVISFATTSQKVAKHSRSSQWKQSWVDQCYAGLVTPAILNGNCADLRITSSTTAQWITPGVSTVVSIKVTSLGNAQKVVRPTITAELDPITGRVIQYKITGSYATNQNIVSLPVHQSETWLKKLFLMELKKAGIAYSSLKAPLSVRNSIKRAQFYQDLSSKSLKEMVVPFLQESINIFGERIFLEASEKLGSVSDSDPERFFLERITGGHAQNAVTEIYDGSGLIAASKIAPELMRLFLQRLTFESYFKTFFAALPVAGESGTIQNRMGGPLTKGKVHAKSGTLDGVSCLSGYYKKSDTELKPFVIITLSDLSASTVLRPMQDKIVTQFVDYNR